MNTNKIVLVVAVLGIAIISGLYYIYSGNKQVRVLPYMEPVEAALKKNTPAGGHHTVINFQLLNQQGQTVTRTDFSKAITVVDFFFSTCQGICPKMTTQMERVYNQFKGNEKVKFLSHTVDPETDSVATLAAYARLHKAELPQWHFVTGDKVQLYQLARESYLIDDTQGDGGKEDFVHSQNFALIDPNGNIRGIYDGLNKEQIDQLMLDVDALLLEFSEKK
ncbi:MAG: SCO family protein [Bacteroidia bacterium]